MESSSNSKGCMEKFTSFVRTQKGWLLIAEIMACILIMILYGASRSASYSSLPVFMLIYCIIMFVIFCCELHHQIAFIHWGWTDFLRAIIGAVAFLITSIVVLISNHGGASIAGGVFGLLTGILFGYDVYTIVPTLRKAHTAAPTGPTDGI